jgi:hypothetical protein
MKNPVKDTKTEYPIRILRSGYWHYKSSLLRTVDRDGGVPSYRGKGEKSLGFRVVKTKK